MGAVAAQEKGAAGSLLPCNIYRKTYLYISCWLTSMGKDLLLPGLASVCAGYALNMVRGHEMWG